MRARSSRIKAAVLQILEEIKLGVPDGNLPVTLAAVPPDAHEPRPLFTESSQCPEPSVEACKAYAALWRHISDIVRNTEDTFMKTVVPYGFD